MGYQMEFNQTITKKYILIIDLNKKDILNIIKDDNNTHYNTKLVEFWFNNYYGIQFKFDINKDTGNLELNILLSYDSKYTHDKQIIKGIVSIVYNNLKDCIYKRLSPIETLAYITTSLTLTQAIETSIRYPSLYNNKLLEQI